MASALRVVLGDQLPVFDLTKVMARVARDHPDWNADRLEAAQLEYRRFLLLSRAYPKSQLSPSKDVDEVWHTHILHTRQYAEDCRNYFGYFLHHEPLNKAEKKLGANSIAKLYGQMFDDLYMGTGQAECCNCDAHEPGDSP